MFSALSPGQSWGELFCKHGYMANSVFLFCLMGEMMVECLKDYYIQVVNSVFFAPNSSYDQIQSIQKKVTRLPFSCLLIFHQPPTIGERRNL